MDSKRYAYNDLTEKKSTLAGAFSHAAQGERWTKWCYLDHNAVSVSTESYRTKLAVKNAVRRVVDDAYLKANRIFTPGAKGCLANEAAAQYGKLLKKRVAPLLDRLEPVLAGDPKKQEQLLTVREMVNNAEELLLARFENELVEEADYYKLYDKSYFIDKVDIEDLSCDVDLFESEFANGLAKLFFNDAEYEERGLLEVMTEMQDDMNSHAQMFFNAALYEYKYFCREVEELINEIGKGITDETLLQVGILKEVV